MPRCGTYDEYAVFDIYRTTLWYLRRPLAYLSTTVRYHAVIRTMNTQYSLYTVPRCGTIGSSMVLLYWSRTTLSIPPLSHGSNCDLCSKSGSRAVQHRGSPRLGGPLARRPSAGPLVVLLQRNCIRYLTLGTAVGTEQLVKMTCTCISHCSKHCIRYVTVPLPTVPQHLAIRYQNFCLRSNMCMRLVKLVPCSKTDKTHNQTTCGTLSFLSPAVRQYHCAVISLF